MCHLIVVSVLSYEKKLLALENGKKNLIFFPFYLFIRNFAKISFAMDYEQLVAARRSHRTFGRVELEPAQVQTILRAALLAPTSRNNRSWQFVVVDNSCDLDKLSDVKEHGAEFVRNASLAVVVVGNPDVNDCWVEDGSIAAFSMQLQAEDMGLASCWVQVRGRRLSDGTPAGEVVRGILDLPPEMETLCIIAVGRKAMALTPHSDDTLKWENVHLEKY